MFKSIRKLCTLPATYKEYLKRTGTGSKVYSPVVNNIHVYVDGKIKVLTDDNGVQFTSSMQFFIDGTCPIKTLDEITFGTITREIRAIRPLYWHNKLDMKVVYTE